MEEYMEAYVVEDDEDIEGPYEDSLGLTPVHYEAVRLLMAPGYEDLSDEEIGDVLTEVVEGMSPEEVEGFFQNLGKFAQNVLPKALPIIGSAVGTVYGGPAGMAVGGALGNLAGQAIGGIGKRRSARPSPRPAQRPAQSPPQGPSTPVPAGGTSALGQLMSLIQNPSFLQSTLGQLMGGAGKSTARVGRQGNTAPFGAFMNALSQLATQAAIEAEQGHGAVSGSPEYLLDESGNFSYDPAVPELRARALLEQLREDYLEGVY